MPTNESCTLLMSRFGQWAIWDNGHAIVGFDYWPEPNLVCQPSALGLEAKRQILCYLDNGRYGFDLPMQPKGTLFQQRVWQAIRAIPVGHTRTYGQVAQQLGSAPRAVGGACRANPVPLLIPCHRIVSQQGVGGFSGHSQGAQIDLKQQLLIHEGACAWPQ